MSTWQGRESALNKVFSMEKLSNLTKFSSDQKEVSLKTY